MTVPPHLTVLTSDRLETLAQRLVAHLDPAALAPFDEEVVVVQSQGTARWLRNELAIRTGCAASVRFPFPAGFCHALARTLNGAGGELDPAFTRDALTWRIFALLEEGLAAEPGFEAIARFAARAEPRKRLGLATRLAARFDDYLLYRADMLLGWEQGTLSGDSPHERWQAALWRRLAGTGEPRHLARWFTAAIERLESAADAPEGLPKRIAIFGVSTLPPLFVRLLQAAGRHVPVRMYVGAPPRDTWARGSMPDPLFAAFGHTSRELLAQCDGQDTAWEEHHAAPAEASNCLAALQAGVRTGATPRLALGAADRSVTLHVCHSPTREVEVLRDQLLDAFEADPTLRPHDILVMVPDVPTYAPVVESVFGVAEPELPRIPFRIADRAMAQESDLAGAMLRLLRLVGARWTVGEILELFDVNAVHRAAGVNDAQATKVAAWVDATAIRWARDGKMREEVFALPPVESNTWRAGLDRLLMGYATGPVDELVAGTLPHAGHTADDPQALGAFAAWVARLFETLDDWRTPRALAAWSDELRTAATELFEPGDEREAASLAQLLECIDSLASLQEWSSPGRELDLALVRDWLERTLGDDSKGAGFLSGGMTVCALKPMRAIPFRIIAVLGLDDGSFPRTERRPAYDLLEVAPRTGDPDRRADDRQLFLDTIMAARDRLILSYVGRSARSNKERAASVVVAELMDAIDRAFDGGTNETGQPIPASRHVRVEHRLQPFAPEYYAGTGRLFSYSRVNARATAAASGIRRDAAPFVTDPIVPPADDRASITLEDLIACWTNPSRFFCEQALELRLPPDEAATDECEPFTVGGLAKYGIHERMFERHRAGGRDSARDRDYELARGELPSGALAPIWFDRIEGELLPFLAECDKHRFEDPVMIRVEGSDWVLTGRVDGITGEGRTQIRPGKLRNKDLVRAWITHLALTAQYPDGEPVTTVVGTDRVERLRPIAEAMVLLEKLVAGYRETTSRPIPVFERASHAYVEQKAKVERPGSRASVPPIDHAMKAFRSDAKYNPGGDDADGYVALAWRGRDPFAAPAEFERYSMELWEPLLAALDGTEEAAT